MRASVVVLVLGLLASFVLVSLASPIPENPRHKFKRDERLVHWLFPRKGGGGGGGGGGGHAGGGAHPSGGGAHPSGGGAHPSGGGAHPSGGEDDSSDGKPGPSGPSTGSGYRTPSDSDTPLSPNGFYRGGSRIPYLAGIVSPLGLTPFFIVPFALWMPINWGPYGAYYYRLNETAPAPSNNTAHNTTDPVLCICENYDLCGCDNANSSYTLPPVLEYAVINGTEYAIINGTLENSTVTYPPTNETTVSPAKSSGIHMGLYLTKTATWGSWVIGGAIVFLATQSL